MPAATIPDNSWVSFPLGGIDLVASRSYQLRLTSPDATPGNAITWWAAPSTHEVSRFAGTMRGTQDDASSRLRGSAVVDGRPLDAAFAFRLVLDD